VCFVKKIKKLIAGALIALGLIALSFGLESTSLLDRSEKKLSNYLYSGRDISDDIVIVAIDGISISPETGLGAFSGWSREYIALAIENISEHSASLFVDLILTTGMSAFNISDLATAIVENDNYEDLLLALSEFLVEHHPHDLAVAEALNEDVFLLKTSATTPELIDNLYHIESEVNSLDLYTEHAGEVYADGIGDGNEQATYGAPIGFVMNGAFEEILGLKMARDYLYPDQETSGQFSDDNSLYYFDEERTIPVEDGQILINYAGEPYSFPMVSFVDVYYGNVDPSVFEGKIVMLGVTASILQDLHFTPIDETVEMPGVEIQANVIQTVLDGAFLEYQSTTSFLMVLGVIALLSSLAFLYLPIWAGAVILVCEVAAYPFYAQWSFNSGVIPKLIWPVFTMIMAYLAALAYRNVTEFREKRKIKAAFGHYVSKDLVEQISQNPDAVKLGGERRIMTTLFLDIENFTSLSEQLDPSAVVSIINQYFDALTEVIMAHGGTVDKFEGDAIMALFGAPLTCDDHGLKACQTALALRKRMMEMNQSTGQNLNIRIGIATGESIVGNMGSQERFDYTAMGDTVNTASRLEGGNKFYGTRILVNPGAFEAAQAHLIFRRVDRVRLKGKDEAIDVYEIMGHKEGTTPEGEAVLNEWHQALEYYRNQQWDEAEARIRKVLAALPEDGPSKTYLKRIEILRLNTPQAWDGTWRFDQK
jgi:adenylate cyclase